MAFNYYPQHQFEGLVKTLNESVGLGVVYRGAEMFDLQQPAEISSSLRGEQCVVISELVLKDANMAEVEDHFSCYGLGCSLLKEAALGYWVV